MLKMKICFMAFLIFISAAALHPDGNFTTSLTGRTGILYGQLGEYVYWTDRTASYLEWDIKPAFTIGLDAEIYFRRGFFAGLAFDAGLPSRTGIMEDSDWIGPDPAVRTHYSRHEAYANGIYIFDLKAGYRHVHSPGVTADLFLGYTFMHFHISGRDGYIEYPPDYEKVSVYGTGITYRQRYHIPYIGLSIRGTFTEKVATGFSVRISPFAACDSLDNHHFTAYDYYDTMQGGFFVSVTGELAFRVYEKQSIVVTAAYTDVPEFKGSTRVVDTTTGVSTTFDNSAGASLSLLSLSIGYRIQAF